MTITKKILLLLVVLTVSLNLLAHMGWSFWNTFALDINEMELD